MADRRISDLIGTMRAYFRFGESGPRLKNNSGVLEVKNAGDTAYAQASASTLGIAGSNASNKVTVTAPAGLAGNVALILPGTTPSSGQVLYASDGSGTLGWTAPISNGVQTHKDSYSEATESPYAIFTPPANAIITRITNNVTSAAAGGSPTISIGISGTVARDMLTTDNDLKTVGTYETKPMTDVGSSPDEIILTLAADGQTFSGEIFIEYSVPTTG